MGSRFRGNDTGARRREGGRRFLLRVMGVLLLAIGVALGFVLGWGTPLGEALFRYDPSLLNGAQAGVQRYVSPALWDEAALPVLERPSWLIPVALGSLLLMVRGLLAPGRWRR